MLRPHHDQQHDDQRSSTPLCMTRGEAARRSAGEPCYYQHHNVQQDDQQHRAAHLPQPGHFSLADARLRWVYPVLVARSVSSFLCSEVRAQPLELLSQGQRLEGEAKRVQLLLHLLEEIDVEAQGHSLPSLLSPRPRGAIAHRGGS